MNAFIRHGIFAILILSSTAHAVQRCSPQYIFKKMFQESGEYGLGHPVNDYRTLQKIKEVKPANLDGLVIDREAYTKLNAEMSKKYPNLKRILDDPIAYKKEIEELFEAQKKIDPVHPYRFDFSEFGKPMLEFMDGSLQAKVITFNKEIAKLKKSVLGKMGLNKKKIQAYETGVKYLEEMLAEVKAYTKNGVTKIDYERFLELSYFYSRAIGMKDVTKFPIHTRLLLKIDEAIDGYKEYSIAKEYELYKKNQFELFAERSSSKGYRQSQKTFEEAFKNKDKLEIVVVPTNTYFDRDIFQRMMPFDIHFLGLTDEPILSEGFLRPGGKFYVHDIRHESARVFEKSRYQGNYQLTPKQQQAMMTKMDQWQLEMNQKINQIEDENLKHAVIFYVFNHHHDRGWPLLPSVYIPEKGDAVPLLLYTVMKVGGQKVDFKNGYQYLPKAYEWLKDFWRPKLGEEISVLKAHENMELNGAVSEKIPNFFEKEMNPSSTNQIKVQDASFINQVSAFEQTAKDQEKYYEEWSGSEQEHQ